MCPYWEWQDPCICAPSTAGVVEVGVCVYTRKDSLGDVYTLLKDWMYTREDWVLYMKGLLGRCVIVGNWNMTDATVQQDV